ncbi:MAG: LLM class flavin-dependent oxidoreductase [SAR202 cluster bacterium]|nr:LLM class flavin-dependent oxidoreductase [SAR202 cluster bacterium]
MQFGLFMMPLHPPYRTFADSYDRDLALIALADQLGYHEAWIGQHFSERWENAPAPDLLIAKALAMTERIILGTGVTLLAVQNPIELAHRIAMLDHLARGRFYWGIGARAIPTDLEMFGLDPKQGREVRQRSAEVLDIVLKMWEADGKFSYHGQFFNIEAPALDATKERGLYMKPYQKPHPPIGVAGTSLGSDSIKIAGERGWIPMSSSNLAPQHLKGHWEVVSEAAASHGREMDRRDWRVARDIFVAETSQLARERAREVLGRNYVQHQFPNRRGYGQLAATKLDPNMPDDAMTVDYMMENVWIVGDPKECAQRIRHLYQQVGGFGQLLAITQDPDDPEWEHECLRLLMNEVGSRVADLKGD